MIIYVSDESKLSIKRHYLPFLNNCQKTAEAGLDSVTI